jgi:hypothetical protein
MVTKRIAKGLSLLFLAAITTGCAAPPPTPARLYNLDNGDIISAEMGYADSGHGLMNATLPTGEICKGEYTIAGAGRSHGPPPYADQTRPPDEKRSEIEPGVTGKDLSWAEAYGYGPGTYVQPIGSATLVGERGSVVEIVIYSYYYYHGVHGDGVARDNHGNWYRVHIGKVPEK